MCEKGSEGLMHHFCESHPSRHLRYAYSHTFPFPCVRHKHNKPFNSGYPVSFSTHALYPHIVGLAYGDRGAYLSSSHLSHYTRPPSLLLSDAEKSLPLLPRTPLLQFPLYINKPAEVSQAEAECQCVAWQSVSGITLQPLLSAPSPPACLLRSTLRHEQQR